MTKNKDKKKSPISKAVFVAVMLLATTLLFPRIQEIKDGGSVIYESICSGLIFEINCHHILLK